MHSCSCSCTAVFLLWVWALWRASPLARNGRRAQQRESSLWLQRGCIKQGLLLLNESCSPAPLPKAQKTQFSWKPWWEVIDGGAVLILQKRFPGRTKAKIIMGVVRKIRNLQAYLPLFPHLCKRASQVPDDDSSCSWPIETAWPLPALAARSALSQWSPKLSAL